MPASPHPHILATTLRSLQRVDPGITKTLAQAGYVVAFREVAEGEWEKMGVEGGLFVYQSTSSPTHGLIILNRNGIKNYQKPLVPKDTSIQVHASWLYVYGVDMDAFRPAQPQPQLNDTPTKRNRRQAKPKQDGSDAVPAPDSPKTRVALYCHSENNVTGSEEASRLAEFLKSLCGTPTADEGGPVSAAEPSTSNPTLTQTTSLPVMSNSQRPPDRNPVSPAPGQAQTAGMSMTALLEKLSKAPNNASPAPPNPARDTLQHSSSFPATHPPNGVTSPLPPPAQPSPQGQDNLTATLKQMLGLNLAGSATSLAGQAGTAPASGQAQQQYPSSLMTPTRTPALTTDSRFQHTATPPAQHQQIHLAPALTTPGMPSQSPHVRPALASQPGSQQVSYDRSQYMHQAFTSQGFPQHPPLVTYPSHQSQPPLPTYSSQPQLHATSPRPPFTHGVSASPSVTQNGGDVFAPRGNVFHPAAAANAIISTWGNRPTAPNGTHSHPPPPPSFPDQNNPEQKRGFVNALLGAIHTDPAFVDRLWVEYCTARRHAAPPG